MRAGLPLAAGITLAVAGCGASSSGGGKGKAWNACAFYKPDVTEFGPGSPDPGDTAWPGEPGLGPAAYVAESRCDFRVADAGAGAPAAAVVARLALLPDRTVEGQEQLLAEEGFNDLRLTSSAADASPQLLAFIPATTANGEAVEGRAELHEFQTIPCGGGAADASFYEYLVLAFSNLDQTADQLIPELQDAMAQIAPAARQAGVGIVFGAGVGCAPPEADGGAPDGGPDGGPDGAIQSALPISELPQALTDAYCARLDECGTETMAVTPPSSCATSVGETLGVLLQPAATAVAMGTLDYSPGAGAACVANLRSAPCASLANVLPATPCQDALVAKQPLGASCFSPFDCEAGGSCSAAADGGVAGDAGADASDGGPRAGTCVPTGP